MRVFGSRPPEHGVHTVDVAKRLHYGFYAPTIYFPLVVKGALMIEPTETETKETLDAFRGALLRIAEEARTQPTLVREARTGPGSLVSMRRALPAGPVLRWAAAPERPPKSPDVGRPSARPARFCVDFG